MRGRMVVVILVVIGAILIGATENVAADECEMPSDFCEKYPNACEDEDGVRIVAVVTILNSVILIALLIVIPAVLKKVRQ